MATRLTKGTTGIGEFFFAHLQSPEVFQGKSTNKFSVSVKLAEKDKKKLLAQIDAEWQKFVESEEGKKHKYKYEYSNGCKEYQGEDYFKFKMTHIIETKKGDWERKVPIFDAQGKNITDSLTGVGNGTKGKIAYELSPFYMNDKNYGVSLRLIGVQILDLVEEGDVSAESLGFGKEDGYTMGDSESTVDDDYPFDDTDENDGVDEF